VATEHYIFTEAHLTKSKIYYLPPIPFSGGQLTAIYRELPFNSKHESTYNFSAILCLILSSMQFVGLKFVVLTTYRLKSIPNGRAHPTKNRKHPHTTPPLPVPLLLLKISTLFNSSLSISVGVGVGGEGGEGGRGRARGAY